MATNFRNLFRFLVPSWLSEGDGQKVLYSLALLKDAALERLEQGHVARMPTRGTPSALNLIGEDRGFLRGRDETEASFRARLVGWRYPRGHRVRGNAYALLEQLWHYLGGVRLRTIDRRGNVHERTALGEESVTYGTIFDWDSWATLVTNAWARFWVVLDDPSIGESDPVQWDIDTPDEPLGITGLTREDIRSIREIVAYWKPAVRAEWLVINTPGVATPDGYWHDWSREIAGVQVATRSPDSRYVSLTPAINNAYAGYSDKYPAAMTMPDGSVYAGVNAYDPTISGIDGSTFAGDPAIFPATIPLVDDG